MRNFVTIRDRITRCTIEAEVKQSAESTFSVFVKANGRLIVSSVHRDIDDAHKAASYALADLAATVAQIETNGLLRRLIRNGGE